MMMLRRIAFVSAPRRDSRPHLSPEQTDQMKALAEILQFPFSIALSAPHLSLFQAAKTIAPSAPVEELHRRTADVVWLRLMRQRNQHMTIVSDPHDMMNLVHAYFGNNHQVSDLPSELPAGSAFYADLVNFRIIRSGVISTAA